MAEQQDDIEIVTANSKNKWLMILIAILLVAVVGLAVMLWLGSQPKTSAETAVATKSAPVYYTVESPFIVNFSEQSQGAVRYLQIKMKVMARKQSVIDVFSQNLPAIQHELLMLFYSQNYDDLQTQGTQALQQKTLENINALLKTETGTDEGLEAVYFTSFLMQ